MSIQTMGVRRRRRFLATGIFLGALWLVPPIVHSVRRLCPVRPDGIDDASALPSFSRKYAVSCTQCHTAYPLLNDFGRRFKMNGYVMGDDDTVLSSKDGTMSFEKLFPWGAIIRSRPYDNSRGSVANQGVQNGGSDGTTRDKMQAVNDVDFFVAGGDASKRVSWMGELDANAAGNFTPGTGDLQAGWHPSPYFNVRLARKSFYAMEPYQTLSSMEQTMIANRAIDGVQPDQSGLSGNILTEQTQTIAVDGSVEKNGVGGLYYMAGLTAGNGDNQGRSRKNANVRLAFDTLKGLVVGGFATFGREQPANVPAIAAGNPNTPIPGAWVKFVKTGVDALVEAGNFVGRGALLYSYDSDPASVGAPIVGRKFRDRAAYAELGYVYKRGGSDKPFLMPMIRENWYTTYNGKRQFNYVSAQLAHYFRENARMFVEYSVDTKTDFQGLPGNPRVPRGNRVTGQIEVGF